MNADKSPEPLGGDQTDASGKVIANASGCPDSGEVSARNFDVQRIVRFSEIADGTTEVIIEHEGQRYRLRATRNGRLLLNK